jgi:hypothetical protein
VTFFLQHGGHALPTAGGAIKAVSETSIPVHRQTATARPDWDASNDRMQI